METNRREWAYIVGIALGDGNLSNPNGRAIRLRITCDTRYPALIKKIMRSLKCLLPHNNVSIVYPPKMKSFVNISVYSNSLAKWIPWHVSRGTKLDQQVKVPTWIKKRKLYSVACLRGLLQTDGCIYNDRGYTMVNFTNSSRPLALDVKTMLESLGYRPTLSSTMQASGHAKYTVRIARDAQALIKNVGLVKK